MLIHDHRFIHSHALTRCFTSRPWFNTLPSHDNVVAMKNSIRGQACRGRLHQYVTRSGIQLATIPRQTIHTEIQVNSKRNCSVGTSCLRPGSAVRVKKLLRTPTRWVNDRWMVTWFILNGAVLLISRGGSLVS